MAWIYLAESEESLKPWLPGFDQSPTVKSSDTLRRSWFLGWQREHYLLPQYGTMCGHFTEEYSQGIQPDSTTMEKLSISLRAASRARISALQEMELAWVESEAVYFSRLIASLANYDPASSSWKTCQLSIQGEGLKLSEPLPRWGMTADGALLALLPLERPTFAKDGSYLPTLAARDYRSPNSKDSQARRNQNCKRGQQLPNYIGLPLHPTWCEMFMGYPAGWTELKGWAMQWYRSKRVKPSKYSAVIDFKRVEA